MDKTAKKMLAAFGTAASVLSAASLAAYATTKYLVNVALNREVPKTIKGAGRLLSGSCSDADGEFVRRVREASERLASSDNETITIISHDGEKLVGHYIPCENAERILIAVHGWRSSWHRDFGMIADFWRENRCSVLYVEQRGQNNSGGAYMGFGLTERFDCLDWIRWILARSKTPLPIYLCGISMGATTVLMAAGLPLPDAVHGILADCGFTSPREVWKHVAKKNLHLAYGIRGAMADAMCRHKIMVGAGDYSTVMALNHTRIPVLLIHGTEDRFVPIRMTYENYLACRAPKELLIVPGAGHGMSYYVEPERYRTTARQFWARYDCPSSKREPLAEDPFDLSAVEQEKS